MLSAWAADQTRFAQAERPVRDLSGGYLRSTLWSGVYKNPFEEVPVDVIKIFRVHPEPPPSGKADLVERLWPCGVRNIGVYGWLKAVSSSTELHAHLQSWQALVYPAAAEDVTRLYSSREREHNNAITLRDYLCARATAKGHG